MRNAGFVMNMTTGRMVRVLMMQARMEKETRKPKKRMGMKLLKKKTKNPTTTENPLYMIPLPMEVMVSTYPSSRLPRSRDAFPEAPEEIGRVIGSCTDADTRQGGRDVIERNMHDPHDAENQHDGAQQWHHRYHAGCKRPKEDHVADNDKDDAQRQAP